MGINAGRLISGISAMIKSHDRVIRDWRKMSVILARMGVDGKGDKKHEMRREDAEAPKSNLH